MREGYIALARKMFDGSDDYWPAPGSRPYTEAEAWIDVIQMAAFRDRVRMNGELLRRGEFCASKRFLAARWSWSKSRVQRWDTSVRKAGRLAVQRLGQSGTVYRVVNYDTYHPLPSGSGTPGGTRSGTDVGHHPGQRRTRDKATSTTSPPTAEHPTQSHGESKTKWLAPFWDAWVDVYGGKPAGGRLAKALKPLVDEKGEEEVLRRWKAYLADTPARYASVERFAQTFGEWGATPEASGACMGPAEVRDWEASLGG